MSFYDYLKVEPHVQGDTGLERDHSRDNLLMLASSGVIGISSDVVNQNHFKDQYEAIDKQLRRIAVGLSASPAVIEGAKQSKRDQQFKAIRQVLLSMGFAGLEAFKARQLHDSGVTNYQCLMNGCREQFPHLFTWSDSTFKDVWKAFNKTL